ncbi:hypothetical protein QJS10_CPB21g01556 [Acorus calamus]|uniref:Uncharacterized protein n=1 Tax=Acorus calamus TaxID=4465 RepID=A0AAV9C5E2_ACOCL|nr:hypothetical protein QJS10_CPB21g01556 [Acorus calamus]
MCILCVIQRWSRRVATMLPWLVIPLIVLWALSQLLPPKYRFEVTPARLACAGVLLVTLFWYHVLMPRLSVWRARRAARLLERRRTKAIELQKLRRTATRRCRNCLTPYRDQNPCGGRFMCSYCGHVSKRPVLDLPGPGPGGVSGPSKLWSCGQDWQLLDNGNWVPSGGGGYSDLCLGGNSYTGAVAFGRRVVAGLFVSLRWVWRKAEERRQAKLEKEMLEEEERKQREEVARLVEERRKLRDEISEAEKGSGGGKTMDIERENHKREMEKRRQERKKEKDKASSKSNSDGEELERRVGIRESEKKREFDRRAALVAAKAQVLESMHGSGKGGGGFNRGSAGKRYFDSVKGSFQKGLGGSSIFGKSMQATQPNAVTAKLNRPTNFLDHGPNSVKHTTIGKSETIQRPVGSDAQPKPTVQKKPWHQLFTRSSSVSPSPEGNTVNQVSPNSQSGPPSTHLPVQLPPTHAVGNQIQYGMLHPFNASPLPNVSLGNNSIPYLENGRTFSPVREPPQDFKLEEAELFEDPCYVPDPMTLLGPVSESLDNFPVDLGSGFAEKSGMSTPHMLKNVTLISDAGRPSPIESPMSRSRISEERHTSCIQRPHTPKEKCSHPEESSEPATWQMWSSHPLQDGLGIVARPHDWLLPSGPNKMNQEDISKGFSTHFMTENQDLPRASSPPMSSVGMLQNGGTAGTFSPIGHGADDKDVWQKKNTLQPLLGVGQNHFSLNLGDNTSRNKVIYERPDNLAAGNPFGSSPLNCWSKKDWVGHSRDDGTMARPPPGDDVLPFPTVEVQSFWSK